MTTHKNFKDFTNLYPINKTLRFSLVPVLTNEQKIEIQKDKKYSSFEEITRQDRIKKFYNDKEQKINIDIQRAEQYKSLKYYLTELHKLFIKDSLEELKSKNIDFSQLFNLYKEYEKSNIAEVEKIKKIREINSEKEKLAKLFADKSGKGGIFQGIAKNYFKYLESVLSKDEKLYEDKNKHWEKNNILLSKNVLRILEEKIKEGKIIEDEEYPLSFIDIKNNQKINLTDYFCGWTTYFKNFNEIRGNLYKDDGRENKNKNKDQILGGNAGQITTRIIDQNFPIFVKNKIIADQNKKILVLKNFENKDIENNLSIFDPKYYINCFGQIDINLYNKKIGELNSFFNEKKQKKGIDKIKYLKTIQKQILLTDDLEEKERFKDIKSFNDLMNVLYGDADFINSSFKKIEKIKDIFGFFLKKEKGVFVLQNKSGLLDVSFNTNKLSFYSNQIFGNWNYIRNLYKLKDGDKKIEKEKNERKYKEKDFSLSLEEIKNLLNSDNEFKNEISKGNFRGKSGSENSIVYKVELDNFSNFLLSMKYYFDGLVDGRELLYKTEEKIETELVENVKKIKEAKAKGERIDEMILKYSSKDFFRKNIKESVKDKKNKILELKNTNTKLNQENDFLFKKYLNEYFDRIIEINKFVSLFEIQEGIRNDFLEKIKNFDVKNNNFISMFNNVRNYITQKGGDLEKIKLNFENQTLLDGWDINKETENLSFVFRESKKYYLGIINTQKNKRILEKKEYSEIFVENLNFEKMEYKQMKDATLSIPKCSTQLKRVKQHFQENKNDFYVEEDSKNNKFIKPLKITKEIFDFNNFEYRKNDLEGVGNGQIEFEKLKKYKTDNSNANQIKIFQKDFLKLSKQEKTYKNSLVVWINFCKDFLRCYPSSAFFNFSNFKDTKKYESIDEFYKDVNKASYSLKFIGIDKKYINEKIEKKELSLFQIYNKDFSEYKKQGSKENLHTLYFKELFSEENQKNPIFKLSGGGEIFFRDEIEDNKKEKQNILKKPKTSEKPDKKRRFSQKNILFHFPIVLNNISKSENINKKIQKYVIKNNDVKILGIDRGEKELAYFCLLDGRGKICGKIKTLNETGSNIFIDKNKKEKKQMINYHSKLDLKERERTLARKSWTKIEKIKDLKQGYVSSVIKDITKLMITENALVCLEELNYGFKRGRIHIEKGIYQQFENALLNKLSCLQLEKTQDGVRNALQLTPEIGAQKYWGNQMGAIFYTDAKFTSATCPNCGFRKRGIQDFNNSSNIKKKIEKGDLKIFYEKDRDRFRIEYNWNYEFSEKNKSSNKLFFSNENLYGVNKMEIVYSDVNRSYFDKKCHRIKISSPTIELKKIFAEDILSKKKIDELFEEKIKNENVGDNTELFFCFKGLSISYGYFGIQFGSILKIRNDGVEKDKNGKKEDIILCSKCHFSTNSKKTRKIENGDANGAYNIARKGIMILDLIRKNQEKVIQKDGLKSKDLKLSLNDWDKETYKQWDRKDWNNSNNPREL